MRKFAYSKIYLHILNFCVSMSLSLTIANAAPVYSNSRYAENVKLSVSMKDSSTILDLFKQIENKSEFVIIYNAEVVDVNTKIELSTVSNSSIEVILNNALDHTPYTYTIDDRQVTISLANRVELDTKEQRKVTGVVMDNMGKTITGATIVVKGTDVAVISAAKGNFAIQAKKSDILIISFMGYKTLEVSAAQPVLKVTLDDNAIIAEEVVVIGYGTMKKSDLTGSISVISGDNIADRGNVSVAQSLQGAVSGVMVTRDGSTPGSGGTIKVRGVTSIGNSDPLIIVDGISVDNIDHVNPDDIESLNVLKDAASASIYGSRAAAGVLLITTKRAKDNKTSLRYSFEMGFSQPTDLPQQESAVEYMTAYNEMRWNDLGNKPGDEYSNYEKSIIDNYDQLKIEEPNKYFDTDWRDLIFQDKAVSKSHNVSIQGGSKFVKSNASFSYDDINSLLSTNRYQKITSRFNNDFTTNDYISATVDVSYKRSIVDESSYNPLTEMAKAPAVFGAMWSDGRVADGKSGNNPYAAYKYGGMKQGVYDRLGGKIGLDIKPVKGLKLSAVLAPTINFDYSKDFRESVPVFSAEDPSESMGYVEWCDKTILKETRNNSYELTTQFFANYDKTFNGKHNLSMMMGYENFYAKYEMLGASRDQYLLDNYPYLNLGPLTYRDNSGSAYENAYRSIFGRIAYNFESRYLVQVNVRYDGSSRFHEDYRWGLFPSISLGWVASQEEFMKSQNVISYMKVRASYGTLGNERIGNYPYQATMSFENSPFYHGTDVVAEQVAYQARYAIRDISWETTESYDVGVDMNFLDNRLRFSGDYYQKRTKDMLLALEIPDYVGFANPNQNTGVMSTKGLDIDLGWNDRVGDFNYSVSVNFSHFESVMGDLGGTQFLGSRVRMAGSEFDEWYGYKSDGIYQTQAEVDDSAVISSAVRPGDVKYQDISGPDGVPDGKITPDYDRVLLGGSLPKYMYGGTIKLGYKGVDFGVSFEGIGKRMTSMASTLEYNSNNWGGFPTETTENNWSHYNTSEQNLDAKYPRLTEPNKKDNRTMSDFWLFNGGYLRIKNMTLGYTIPSKYTKKLMVNNLRVYISANDFLSIDRYPEGYDPESSRFKYPIMSSFLGGVSITF